MTETRASSHSPAQPQMTLLGYKELSAWNESDLRTVTLFDIIFLPPHHGSLGVVPGKSRAFIRVRIHRHLAAPDVLGVLDDPLQEQNSRKIPLDEGDGSRFGCPRAQPRIRLPRNAKRHQAEMVLLHCNRCPRRRRGGNQRSALQSNFRRVPRSRSAIHARHPSPSSGCAAWAMRRRFLDPFFSVSPEEREGEDRQMTNLSVSREVYAAFTNH